MKRKLLEICGYTSPLCLMSPSSLGAYQFFCFLSSKYITGSIEKNRWLWEESQRTMYKSNLGSLFKHNFPSITDNRRDHSFWDQVPVLDVKCLELVIKYIYVKKKFKNLWRTLIGVHKVIFTFKNFIIKILFCLYTKTYDFIPYFFHRDKTSPRCAPPLTVCNDANCWNDLQWAFGCGWMTVSTKQNTCNIFVE